MIAAILHVWLGTSPFVMPPPMSTSSSGVLATGACASMASGDVCCFDNDGVRCGWPTTDALADDIRIYGFSASPIGAGANLVGQDLLLAGGEGSMTLVATQANCGAGDTVTVAIDGTANVCTRDAATDSSTLFTCGASDAAMATNMAACLTQKTGVDACAGAGCSLFTGVAGTVYVYRDSTEDGGGVLSVSSSGDHAVAANGTDGVIRAQGSIDIGDAGVRLSGDGDGAITFLGLGNGTDEDLTLNLDDTSNVGTFTSSTALATLNFSSIVLQETGVDVLNNNEIDASSELLAIMDDETGTGALCFATAPVFTTNIDVGSTGVRLSDDGDGAITFKGLGDGSDEDLTVNLDDVANTATFTSSTGVTSMVFPTDDTVTSRFQDSTGSAYLYIRSYGNGATGLGFDSYGGTPGSETATLSGNLLMNFLARGWTTAAYSGGAMQFIATENWSATDGGTKLVFYTTPDNTTTLTSRWTMSDLGHWLASTDNAVDIGASGATRPRDVYVADDVVAAGDVQSANLISTTLEANLTAGACTAGTWKVDNTTTRELCRCNDAGSAYDCISVTTTNGPTD